MTNRQVLEALKPHLPGDNLAALARRIGISPPSLWQMWNGNKSPGNATLTKLAEIAGGSFVVEKRLKLPGKKLQKV